MGFGIIVKRKATGNQSFSLVRFSLVHREDEISDCQSVISWKNALVCHLYPSVYCWGEFTESYSVENYVTVKRHLVDTCGHILSWNILTKHEIKCKSQHKKWDPVNINDCRCSTQSVVKGKPWLTMRQINVLRLRFYVKVTLIVFSKKKKKV